MFAFANAAAANTVVHGTVSWDVLHASSGSVTLYGQTQGQSVEAPLVINASGFYGTYSVSVPVADDYSLSAAVGDCPDAATGNAYLCNDWANLATATPTTVTGASVKIDFNPPAGFGPVAASGTATLSGTPAIGGSAQFSYFASDATASVQGVATVSINGKGHYSATVGSGFVSVFVQPKQVACIKTQSLSNSNSNVAAGTSITLDVSGDALPAAPPPGAIRVRFGVTGVSDAIGQFETTPDLGQQDCAGGWSDPELFSVTAGSYLMASGFSGSTAISPGTYTPSGRFNRPAAANVRNEYDYPQLPVTVKSGQTVDADYRFAAAFVHIQAPIDWSQFGALDPNQQSNVFFSANSSAPAGALIGASTSYSIFAASGLQNYVVQMPIDPALHWSFAGAQFALYSADGTFKNIELVPGICSVTSPAPAVPPVTAGHSANYDLTALAKVGVGHLEFAPRTPPASGPFLDGNGSEVVTGQGIRIEYLHYNAPFGATSATATVMPGQQTLSASWYDANFNALSDSLNLDIRPNESVSLSESAPHVDNVQPVPGNVCVATFKVTGTATDPDRVASVTVNGVEADVKSDGSFSRSIKIPVGDSTIVVRATDRKGNVIVRTRPIHRNANNSGC